MCGRSGRTSLAWAVLAYQYIRVAYDWIDASIVWKGATSEFCLVPLSPVALHVDKSMAVSIQINHGCHVLNYRPCTVEF
jgi:hypothetical protein